MKIEVCGPGCPRCHAAKENVQKAVKDLGLQQEIEVAEIKDIMDINSKGILLTPGIIIEGAKVSEGRIPNTDEIKKWIEEKIRKEK